MIERIKYKRYIYSITIGISIFLILANGVEATTPLSSCTTISLSGNYILTQDIINSNNSMCIKINTSDVTLDGAGYTIDGKNNISTYGVYVFNQSPVSNITIKNLNITDWHYGIYYTASNGTISNNTVYYNSNGIVISSSNNNTLTNNTVNENSEVGIVFLSSNYNILTNNIVNTNIESGMDFSYSNYNILANNNINENSQNGIYADDFSNNNTFINNNIYMNLQNGIYFGYSSKNILINNNVIMNGWSGLYFDHSGSNILTNNNASMNTWSGLSMYYSGNNTIVNNTVNMNSQNGMYLYYMESSGSNVLMNNTVNMNGQNGIYLYHNNSNGSNVLIGNIANMNNYNGIYFYYSNINTLTNNIANMNGQNGIYLYSSLKGINSNILISNIANMNNQSGIYLFGSIVGNDTLINNIMSFNGKGISLYSSEIIIYNNYFNNTINANFGTLFSSNKWNTTLTNGANIVGGPYIGGNYWAHPNGTGFSLTCQDLNIDGICDSQYSIKNNNIDYLPLTAYNNTENGIVKGKVTNASTGIPISNAIISIGNITTTTNTSGYYNISIKPDTYIINTSAYGFVTNNSVVTVISGIVTTKDIILYPILNITAFPYIIMPNILTNITFNVTHLNLPVNGAEIALRGSFTDNVTTNENGIAVVSVNTSNIGIITATANKQGYINATTKIYVIPIINLQVSAIRKIETSHLSPGNSTNITITVTSNTSEALSVQEFIPEGWNLTKLQDDSDDFKQSTNEWVFFNMTPNVSKEIKYKLTMPSNTPVGDKYYINGTVSNKSGVIAYVSGDKVISSGIISYYRRLGNNPNIIETTDLLSAADDWSRNITPPGYITPLTTQQLLIIADEWRNS